MVKDFSPPMSIKKENSVLFVFISLLSLVCSSIKIFWTPDTSHSQAQVHFATNSCELRWINWSESATRGSTGLADGCAPITSSMSLKSLL